MCGLSSNIFIQMITFKFLPEEFQDDFYLAFQVSPFPLPPNPLFVPTMCPLHSPRTPTLWTLHQGQVFSLRSPPSPQTLVLLSSAAAVLRSLLSGCRALPGNMMNPCSLSGPTDNNFLVIHLPVWTS